MDTTQTPKTKSLFAELLEPVRVGAVCVVGLESGVAYYVVVELGEASAGIALTSLALEHRLNWLLQLST